jgi:hypothetical protein
LSAWRITGVKIFFISCGGLSSIPEGPGRKPFHAFSLTFLSRQQNKEKPNIKHNNHYDKNAKFI